MVDVLTWSMFWCSWCLRSLRACPSQPPPCIYGNWSIMHTIGSNWIHAYQLTLKVKFYEIALISSFWPKFWAIKCWISSKMKIVTTDSIFNLVCSFGAIVCTHVGWPWKSNLRKKLYSALQEEHFELSYVKFRQKIKKLQLKTYFICH